MDTAAIDRFIDLWGELGSSWGISTSVARVHALLIVSDRPWCLDEIAERLQISKSNVSMSLKELRGWKVVRRVHVAGDRREFYTSEADPWQMLLDIARERKRREFDPLLAGVRSTLEQAQHNPGGVDVERLRAMAQMLGSFDKLAERALGNGLQARAMMAVLLGKR